MAMRRYTAAHLIMSNGARPKANLKISDFPQPASFQVVQQYRPKNLRLQAIPQIMLPLASSMMCKAIRSHKPCGSIDHQDYSTSSSGNPR